MNRKSIHSSVVQAEQRSRLLVSSPPACYPIDLDCTVYSINTCTSYVDLSTAGAVSAAAAATGKPLPSNNSWRKRADHLGESERLESFSEASMSKLGRLVLLEGAQQERFPSKIVQVHPINR